MKNLSKILISSLSSAAALAPTSVLLTSCNKDQKGIDYKVDLTKAFQNCSHLKLNAEKTKTSFHTGEDFVLYFTRTNNYIISNNSVFKIGDSIIALMSMEMDYDGDSGYIKIDKRVLQGYITKENMELSISLTEKIPETTKAKFNKNESLSRFSFEIVKGEMEWDITESVAGSYTLVFKSGAYLAKAYQKIGPSQRVQVTLQRSSTSIATIFEFTLTVQWNVLQSYEIASSELGQLGLEVEIDTD